jgi:hypothetical protein
MREDSLAQLVAVAPRRLNRLLDLMALGVARRGLQIAGCDIPLVGRQGECQYDVVSLLTKHVFKD